MRSFLSIIFLVACGHVSMAQQNVTDSIPKDTVLPKRNTLTLAALYASDASYFGQRPDERSPYTALAATWQLKSGIYITGLAYKILTDKTSDISAANIGAGINWNFSKQVSGDIRYTHSFYPELSPLIQSINTETVSLELKHTKWMETSLTGDYAFGKTNDVFATAAIAKDIDLFSVSQYDIVSIKPSLSVIGGTQRYYNSYIKQQQLRDSVLGIITGPILGNPSPGNDTTAVAASSFDIISYNFELPLSYSRSHYVIQAACQLALLGKQAQSQPGKLNTFFTFSFYYQF